MSYLTKLGRCFTKEDKQIEWLTPSNFLVKQSYQKTFSKKIKTQMGHSTIRLTLLEDLDEIDIFYYWDTISVLLQKFSLSEWVKKKPPLTLIDKKQQSLMEWM